MSKSKNKFKSQDARLCAIESKVIEPPSVDIPNNAVDFARSIGFEPDTWQAQVLNSQSKRIAVLAGRQVGKSVTCALLALWTCLVNKNATVIIISPSIRQSQLLFRAVLTHYERANKPLFKAETTLALELTNGSRCIALPGSQMTIRGYSAQLICADESAQIPDELYYSVMPMLAVTDGVLIVVSSPFGERGWFHDVYTNNSPEWERIKVKSSECSRITDKFLEQAKREMGEYWYQSEYECEFLAPESSMFSTEAIHKIFDNDLLEYSL